jgi:hypothetical protein
MASFRETELQRREVELDEKEANLRESENVITYLETELHQTEVRCVGVRACEGMNTM